MYNLSCGNYNLVKNSLRPRANIGSYILKQKKNKKHYETGRKRRYIWVGESVMLAIKPRILQQGN